MFHHHAHHHCGCPYHHRGMLCPRCDGPENWPRSRDAWEEPTSVEVSGPSDELEDLRRAVERLTERLDELEAE